MWLCWVMDFLCLSLPWLSPKLFWDILSSRCQGKSFPSLVFLEFFVFPFLLMGLFDNLSVVKHSNLAHFLPTNLLGMAYAHLMSAFEWRQSAIRSFPLFWFVFSLHFPSCPFPSHLLSPCLGFLYPAFRTSLPAQEPLWHEVLWGMLIQIFIAILHWWLSICSLQCMCVCATLGVTAIPFNWGQRDLQL